MYGATYKMEDDQLVTDQPRREDAIEKERLTNKVTGLQNLQNLDLILVKQQANLVEALLEYESSNKYAIMNSHGRRLLYAAEKSTWCNRVCCCGKRHCCGTKRKFDMDILDNSMNKVFSMHRKLRPCSCIMCCRSCLQEVEVTAPGGTAIGFVQQVHGNCHSRFEIQDQNRDAVMYVEGACCRSHCCSNIITFKLLNLQKEKIGRISKEWSGLSKEVFTDADNYGISFPIDTDVKIKACIIASVFLLDFMYFEDGKKTSV